MLYLPTFIKDFDLSKEPFAILEKRIYTLHKKSNLTNPENFLYFLGQKYTLEESEEISLLENEFFDLNRKKIEEFMSSLIQSEFINKIKSLDSTIRELTNVYSSLKGNALEKFIKENIFVAYYNLKPTKDKDSITDKIRTSNVEVRYPSVDELKSEKNSFINLFGDKKLLILLGRCYNLEIVDSKRELSEYIRFKNNFFKISHYCFVEDLEKKYLEGLIKRIMGKSIEHGKKFYEEIIKQRSNKKESLEQELNRKRSDKLGILGFEKINDDRYKLYILVNPYVIKKDNNYYFIKKAVRVGTELLVSSDSLKIVYQPRIFDMPYNHIFVRDDGGICFGTFRWVSVGVIFDHWYNLKNPDLAEKIAGVLRQAEDNLTLGWIGTPGMDNPSAFDNCLLTGGRKEALRLVGEERIFDNDKTSGGL